MAQVYTFTDSNGEVRLAAEINPAPGGSLPSLTVGEDGGWTLAPGDASAIPLSIEAGYSAQAVPFFRIHNTDDDTDLLALDEFGDLNFDARDFNLVGDLYADGQLNASGMAIDVGGAYHGAGEQILRAYALGLKFNYTAALADGQLLPSWVSLWFDDTDGAAKLMVKGKTANGTVRTGSVVLS